MLTTNYKTVCMFLIYVKEQRVISNWDTLRRILTGSNFSCNETDFRFRSYSIFTSLECHTFPVAHLLRLKALLQIIYYSVKYSKLLLYLILCFVCNSSYNLAESSFYEGSTSFLRLTHITSLRIHF